MKDWKKFFEEKVRPEHRQDVLKTAETLLRENEVRNPSRRTFWFWATGAGTIGVTAALSALIFSRYSELDPAELEVANFDEDLVEDEELLADLDLLEDLEVLEKWNDG